MKNTKSKPAVAQPKRNGAFFSKGGSRDFFGPSKGGSGFFGGSTSCIQTKLTIGKANDPYEQEADAVADKVVQRMTVDEKATPTENTLQSKPLVGNITPVVQRKCTACEQEEQLQKKEESDDSELKRKPIFESDGEDNRVQRKCAECEQEDDQASEIKRKPIFESEAEGIMAQRKCAHCEQEEREGNSVQRKENAGGDASSSSLENKLNEGRSSGSPLPEEVNHSMSGAFGSDFSHVRVHTDSSAVSMSKDLHAQAFTYGNDIYFNSGKYDTNSTSGRHLLAHELTHTVQQGGDVKSKKIAKRVQRVSLYYWNPPGYSGTRVHNIILNQISQDRKDYIIEAPIPNANRDKLGSGATADYDKKGAVDLYKGTGTQGDTVMGVYFFAPGKPVRLQQRGTTQGGAPFTGPVAPVYKQINNVDKVGEAPTKIALGDLKPINSLESSYGKEQLDAYGEGIEKYAADGVNALSPSQSWKPKVNKISGAELDRIVPDRFRRNSTSNPIIETSFLKGPGTDRDLRVRTQLVAIPDKVTKGILAYAWVPIDPVGINTIPARIAQMGRDVTRFIINPLNRPLSKRKAKGPQKKSMDGDKAVVPTAKVKGVQPKKVQRDADEFELKEWQQKREKLIKEYKSIKGSKDVRQVEGLEKKMRVDELLEKRLGITKPNYSSDQTQAVGDLKSIKFWTNPLTGLFGIFKNLLGSAYDVFATGFTKLKGWIQGIARKLKFESKTGGLLGSAFKAIFNLLKVVARITVSTAIELLKQDIVNGIHRKIEALMKSLDIDKDIAYIKSVMSPVQNMINSVENWITTTLSKFNSYFDKIHKVIEAFSFINDIVSTVRWAARAIACVSPPLVGCLWNLLEAALEKAASYVVETCWFRSKIAPLVLKVDFVKGLGKDLYTFIKKHIVEFLPSSLQEIFVDKDEKPVPTPNESEIKCQGGEGGDGEGGGEITPEQEAVMRLQEQLGEEKFLALLELTKKAKTDANTLMSSDQIAQLAKAVENMSADEIKKMAEAYQKGDSKSVPADVKKVIENLKNAPKGTPAGEPDLDAKAKEAEVEAREAQRDAAEAQEEGETQQPDNVKASSHPAAFLLNLMLNAKAKKDQIIYEERGKLVVNKRLQDTLLKTGVQIYELKIAGQLDSLDVTVKEATRDNLTVQQVRISLDLYVTTSDNPLIRPGLSDHYSVNALYDSRTHEALELHKPAVVTGIVEGIQSGKTDLVSQVYNFKEFNFKARLTNIKVQQDIAELSFITTEIMPGQIAAIFDFKRNKFITLKVGEPFLIKDQCTDCNQKIVQKSEIKNGAQPGLQRTPAFDGEQDRIQRMCEQCGQREMNLQRVPLPNGLPPSVQRDPVPEGEADSAAQKVYDALSGWTDSDDSAIIRTQIVGKSKSVTDAIVLGVANRANESVTYAMEWMESDMVTSDWNAVLGHFITVRAYLVERIIGYKLHNLLLGYTSEDDSKVISALLMGTTPVSGDLLDNSLVQLEAKGEYTRDFAAEKLFDDMQGMDAQRLSAHFFGSGERAQGYATHWRAYKIKNLIAGFTGINDSESIVKNFDAVPGKLKLVVLFELERLCQETWKEPAEKLLMENMQQDDYEKLRVGMPSLAVYNPTKSWLSWTWGKLTNLADYIEGAFEHVLCGVLGIILGILSIITDLIGAIIDIVVAAKDLLGMIIYYVTGGKFCRESKEKVFNFFKGLGDFFGAPGEAIGMMWNELTGEAALIEGPFQECKQAVYWVTRITNLVVNIVLIFVAGYGAVKLALEGIESIILLVRSGELLNALKAIPGKLWTAIKKLPPAIAKAIANNVKAVIKLITNPAKVIAAIRETASLVKLAATDEKFFLFLRQQANEALKKNLDAFKEKELEFWQKRKTFWTNNSAQMTTSADAVDAKLVDAANTVTDDVPKAEKIAAEAETEASNLSKEADDVLDDIATTGGEGTKSLESKLPENWREGMPDRPPRLGTTATRMRGLGVSEDTILGIIKNASLSQGYNPTDFFGDLNLFIIRYETVVGRAGFDEILRGLASEKDFVMARTLMTQASRPQSILEIMKVLNVPDVAALRPRFAGLDKDFINDLTKIVSRIAGGREEIFVALQDAGDPASLNKALDRLGEGRHTLQQIRESLSFGQQLSKAVATNADAVAKAIWGDAIELDVEGKVVRDAKGQLKFTGKLPPDQASAYIRARRDQIADVILNGHGGTAIDNINWGIMKEVLTNADLPPIVKNDILGEVWAFTKVRQYENLGYTVIREVFFKIVGGESAGTEAHLDAVLKKGNEIIYKEFKSSASASTTKGQGKVYDLLNKGATESLKPYGPNAESAFGGPGCPNFKAKAVEFDRPPF